MVAHPSPEADDPGPPLQPLGRELPLAERSYQALREQIATGSLSPGQRLTERSLAALLGVSPTPVREALRRLEQEGLITRAGPRTLQVVEHSEEALRELLFVEVVLRAAQARFAVSNIDQAGIDRMSAAVDRLAQGTRVSEEDLLVAAAAFDAELVSAANNPALETMIASAAVVGHARRVQAVAAMRQTAPDVGRRQLQAHRDILDAVGQRDADAVEALVRAQLLASLELLLAL